MVKDLGAYMPKCLYATENKKSPCLAFNANFKPLKFQFFAFMKLTQAFQAITWYIRVICYNSS